MSINRYIYCTDVQKLLEKKYFDNLDINRQSLFLPSLTLARFAWIDVVSVGLRLTCSFDVPNRGKSLKISSLDHSSNYS